MLIVEQPTEIDWNALSIETIEEGIVLSVNKPYGWTSADVVRKIKFTLQQSRKIKKIKVGHAGTLDPLATGVLLICIGKATKTVEKFQAQEKTYITSIRLGATTSSYDLEKEIDQTYPYEHITQETIEKELNDMVGCQEQIPPQFSAKIINGTRVYKRARIGVHTILTPSIVEIYETSLVQYNLPDIVVQVRCSKGTYIRAFARDLGVALKSGAHLTNLVRIQSGVFHVSKAITIEQFEQLIYRDHSIR